MRLCFFVFSPFFLNVSPPKLCVPCAGAHQPLSHDFALDIGVNFHVFAPGEEVDRHDLVYVEWFSQVRPSSASRGAHGTVFEYCVRVVYTLFKIGLYPVCYRFKHIYNLVIPSLLYPDFTLFAPTVIEISRCCAQGVPCRAEKPKSSTRQPFRRRSSW